jgi:hypothetical protein
VGRPETRQPVLVPVRRRPRGPRRAVPPGPRRFLSNSVPGALPSLTRALQYHLES